MITSFLNDVSDLEDRLSEFCTASQIDQTVKDTVSEILHEIRKSGDTAMLEKTLKYDHAKLSQNEIKVTKNELEEAKSQLTVLERESILEAIENVSLFHERSIPENWTTSNNHGAKVGEKFYPINRVGIYVPGGNVPLISTVIMTVTIANVAKVKEIAVVTPPDSEGKIAPQMLAALELLGVDEIYKVGGSTSNWCISLWYRYNSCS